MRLKCPKIENDALKNIVLSSLRPCTKIAGRHEQVSNHASSLVYQNLTLPNPKEGDGIYGWPLKYFAMNDIVFFGNKETGIV